ncbi:TRAP transporter small permease [Bordetella sp. BOR01]|uniref:TRAP transporter small permease n=1 Tax=Bordetella sp. BOR01 TaxID=2854779 RepID=UPI001C46FEFF|nr:TRAP transporter small permease [Bordetella sp. BOR01]MBV7485323.1 TRAP transporter small permease [Bordetella sp. BOR01]
MLSGIATVLLMLSVVPDILARSLFGEAVYGMAEAGIMLLVLIVFLAMPVAQVKREHFQVTVLDALLPAPAIRWVQAIRYLACTLISGGFAWYAIRGAIASTQRLEQSYAVVAFPVWPAKILAALGLALLAVVFLLDTLDACRGDGDAAAPVNPVAGEKE